MSDPTGARSSNFCYRHPDRQSFVLCQRCGRTICAECQTPAPVGVICPECMRAQRQAAPRTRSRGRLASLAGAAPVTVAIIAICVVVYLIDLLTHNAMTTWLAFYSPFVNPESDSFSPWRILTAAFVHGGVLHLLMNMLTLYLFGRALEPLFGSLRFATMFAVTAIGGSLAVALLAPQTVVVGASGAIFGLFGAWFVVLRRTRESTQSMLILIGINLVIGFVLPGIAWQAHLGGLIVGAVCGLLCLNDLDQRRVGGNRRFLGEIGMLVLGALCTAGTILVAA